MSELQNRIIERLTALDRSQRAGLSSDKREKLMTAAIGLYYASGGDAVAQMVVATAAVSCALDLDLVQAAYNWIDNTPVSLSD